MAKKKGKSREQVVSGDGPLKRVSGCPNKHQFVTDTKGRRRKRSHSPCGKRGKRKSVTGNKEGRSGSF